MSDPQLACALCAAPALLVGSLWLLGDLAGRAVGGIDAPADPVDAFLAIGRAAQAAIAAAVAAIASLAGGLFGWAVRP